MKAFYMLIFSLIASICQAQPYTISGMVEGLENGESLIGASIYEISTGDGTTSNNYGFYSLTLESDSVDLRISFVGYQPVRLKFFLRGDTSINVSLHQGTDLETITITGAEELHESSSMGTIDLPVEQIRKMPAFMGETDVLKVLQLLPGVQSGVEGTSGLYVRGGGPDQNLILLDGVPLYNVSHLFGFFSIFNGDAINRVELIKGGFPARYGGRLSSVIDVSMKEGNAHEFKGEGAIGLVASRLTLEGPIGKKTSFIVSGRRTYIDLLASPIIKAVTEGTERTGYYFYDLNAKVNHTVNAKNRIYISAYMGDDKGYSKYKDKSAYEDQRWENESDASLRWGNLTTALRWNRVINEKLFANATATYSRYRFAIGADQSETYSDPDTTWTESYATTYISGIKDFAVRFDFDFIPTPAHYIRFGAQAINHTFSPGVLSFHATEVSDTTIGAQLTHANEFFAYAEDDFRISDQLKVNGGVHVSAFHVDGRTYHSFQPRISGRYLVGDNLSLKASYAQMAQYIHLLSNVGIGLPTDLWVPSTGTVEPQRAWIGSAGAAWTVANAYEFSLEGYYKEMEGLIEYKDGASYFDIETDWQTKVESGTGESYGAEVFLHKKTGRLNGWVGYTLSWSTRQFPNLNEGRTYPYKYDRRHDIGIALAYQLKPGRDLSLTWVYGTGVAVTLPKSQYAANASRQWWGEAVSYYGDRNSFQMNDYHRLDLSYTMTKKTKWGERSWVVGVYNMYNRRNPFFMEIGFDDEHRKRFIQYSLFPLIPSFSYRFKF